MTAAKRLDAPGNPQGEDVWGWCDPCGRWFYPPRAGDPSERFTCPVCATPAARRGTRADATG